MKLKRSRRTGRLLHARRPVSTRRPMHITLRVRDDVPRLRRPEVLRCFRELVAAARERGVRSVASVLMGSHLHWVVVPESADALREATKFVFSRLAKFINRLFGRRGRVFVERYYSQCCHSVRQSWQALGYVLRNPVVAGYRVPAGGLDRYTEVCEDVLAADPFLRSVVGPTPRLRRALLVRMTRGPVPFVPLAERLQPCLPGL